MTTIGRQETEEHATFCQRSGMDEAAVAGRGAAPRPSAAALERTAERLGLHHFAYLRALAEGVPVPDAAARYLHIDHARAARDAHRLVIERARALARQRGDPAWRLVGIEIRLPSAQAAPAQAGAEAACLPWTNGWRARDSTAFEKPSG